MKSIQILCAIFFISLSLNAQVNLLYNGGFEEFTSCYSTLSNDTNRLVSYWSNPIAADSLSQDPCDEAWVTRLKAIESHSGSAVQYILVWYDDPRVLKSDNRSYLISRLKQPLVENHTYFFRMYVRCIFNNLEGFCMANGQGVAFSKTLPQQMDDQGRIALTAAIQSEKMVDTFWREVSGCFRAKGGEEYAVLGNFKTKDSTIIKRLAAPKTVDPTINPNFVNNILIGSYIVDDVELIPLSINVPNDTTICEGESLVLDMKNNLQATYNWQDGTTTPQYKVTKSGVYKVIMDYTIDNSHCKVEQAIRVNVLPKVKPTQSFDTTLCLNQTVLLKVGTGRKDDVFRWQDNSAHDTFRVTKDGVYLAEITNSCGTYRESYKVNFVNCRIETFVPNVFSPNGDNINDTFSPFVQAAFPITDYEFAVFNRWGARLFSTTDMNRAWDGTFQGKNADNGIYIWYFVMKGTIGTKKIMKTDSGDVNLIR